MRICSLALALTVMVSPVAAQEPPPLTLEEARALAAEHNPTYRQAQNDLIRAHAAELQSRAAFLPDLNLSFGSSGYLSRTFTGVDPLGNPIRTDDPSEVRRSSSSQGISLGMLLFDGGQRLRQLRVAQAGRDATEEAAAVVASSVDAELTRRYFAAQQATALIQLEEDLLRAAEARYSATQQLLRVASVTPVALLGAEIEVARQRQAVDKARGEARKAMLLLAEQIGTGDAGGWDLVTEIPAVFDPSSIDPEALVARAHAVSPRLRELSAQVRVADQQRRAAGAVRWPRVSANSSFNRGIGSEGYGSLFDPNPVDQSFSFGVNISLPLFSQYQTTQQVTQARVAAMNAEENARATRLQLDREVRSALIDLESAYRTVELAEANITLARRQLDLANQEFRLGSTSFTELQTIIASAASAEREALSARYSFATNLATLQERVGEQINVEF